MITEKQLLKWGFIKTSSLSDAPCMFVISRHRDDFYNVSIIDEYVEWDIERGEFRVYYAVCRVLLTNCTTKRKADQALRLLGLPSIDKLNTIKK